MPRDRLNELRQAQKKNDQSEIQIENITTENTNKEDHQKKFRETFERAEVVGQWLEQIEKNIQDIKSYIKRIDDVKFDQKDLEQKLQSLFQNNTSIAQKISAKIKEVEEELKNITSESAEARIKNIQYTTLKTRFQKALQQNNLELENYRNIQKQIIKAQLGAKNIQVTDEELTSLLDEGKDLQIFTENILAETAEAKRILADVEERHQQLLQIERMLTEVRDLFIQMSILVDNQQELIDRIEYQAQAATEYVGAVDLKTVRKMKKKYLKRKLYLLLALAVVIIIIVILIIKA